MKRSCLWVGVIWVIRCPPVSTRRKIDLGQLSRIHAFRCVFLLDLRVFFWKLQCIYIYTVDGRNPAPVEVGSLSHYLQVFIHHRWLFGISEPSTVALLIPK